MTVTALPPAGRIGTGPHPDADLAGWVPSRHHATSAAGLVHDATAPLLAALEGAVSAAAARGINDTGARRIADALREARIALDFAIVAAGHALADREMPVRP
ncbi:hypothetical protein ACFQE5_14120 [Pseudonocardia hispaniensis]|uniref:Uncharacterized protein n=1 Tax=Pseudonocardia hispaniensis TaxID=904933 RepID=A0ABW1J4M3_9PSEU